MTGSKSIIQRLDEPSIPWSVVVRVAIGAYFIYAGIGKAMAPFAFMKAIRLYDMLPDDPAIYLNSTTVILPWLEIVCGVALVVGLFRRGAGMILVLMLCVFTPAIFLRALAVMGEENISFFAIKFDCGCGGGPEIIWFKLLKNTGYFLAALVTVVSRSSAFSLSALIGRYRAGKAEISQDPIQKAHTEAATTDAGGTPDIASP